LSNLTGPQGVQSKDGLPSYDLWSEMGVFCSQLEPRPRRILWTIGLEDEQFTASPPVPALGGLEAPPEGLNLHGDLKDREEAIAESQRLRLEAYQSWGGPLFRRFSPNDRADTFRWAELAGGAGRSTGS
jgi:hypothetical protein